MFQPLFIPSRPPSIGAARHIDEYAEAGARYVNTRQQGAANTQRAYADDWCREHGR
jgi:hypothetical protein